MRLQEVATRALAGGRNTCACRRSRLLLMPMTATALARTCTAMHAAVLPTCLVYHHLAPAYTRRRPLVYLWRISVLVPWLERVEDPSTRRRSHEHDRHVACQRLHFGCHHFVFASKSARRDVLQSKSTQHTDDQRGKTMQQASDTSATSQRQGSRHPRVASSVSIIKRHANLTRGQEEVPKQQDVNPYLR